jgi:leader peptidase (prepilin peptidase)/N-methyltransferase
VDLLPALPAYLYFGAIGVVLALIEVDTRTLPDMLVLPSYAVILILLAAASAWQHDWPSLLHGVLGGGVFAGSSWVIALCYPSGMSLGDVKLSGLIGMVLAYVSWGTLAVGAIVGLLLGSIVVIAGIVRRDDPVSAVVPLGSALLAWSLIAILVG